MARILIIEDDLEISGLLSEFLQENGYRTFCLYHGLHVPEAMRDHRPDLVLLDLMLPYRSGDQVLTDIRANWAVPVIIISAKGTTRNKIDLLRSGADDYITKPFDLEEALARIESNLRRTALCAKPDRMLRCGELLLDEGKNTASVKGAELSLTAKEYRILELLLQYPDKIFSKANLFESVWASDYFSEDNTLNVHISNLRNKLKALSPDEEYIDTVWGIGYRLHKS